MTGVGTRVLLFHFLSLEKPMLTRRRFICGSLAALMVYGTIVAAGDLKSGPQPGKGVPSFNPLNIHNAESPSRNGKESCFV